MVSELGVYPAQLLLELARELSYLHGIKIIIMKSKYLPELVLMWIIAVMVFALVTSCSSTRPIRKTMHVVSGSSEWKHVELKGNKQ